MQYTTLGNDLNSLLIVETNNKEKLFYLMPDILVTNKQVNNSLEYLNAIGIDNVLSGKTGLAFNVNSFRIYTEYIDINLVSSTIERKRNWEYTDINTKAVREENKLIRLTYLDEKRDKIMTSYLTIYCERYMDDFYNQLLHYSYRIKNKFEIFNLASLIVYSCNVFTEAIFYKDNKFKYQHFAYEDDFNLYLSKKQEEEMYKSRDEYGKANKKRFRHNNVLNAKPLNFK